MTGLLNTWAIIAVIVGMVWHGPTWFARKTPSRTATLNGERYSFHEERSKAGILGRLLLTFDVPPGTQFRLRRQSWFDTFAKGTRLATEPEVGEPVFDDLFFVDSNDEAFNALIREHRPLRSLLITLLSHLKRQKARLIALDAENGTLSLYLKVFWVTHPAQLRDQCVTWLAPLLKAVRERTTRSGPHAPVKLKPGDAVRLTSLAIFALGSGSLGWVYWMSPDRLLDGFALLRLSMIFGVAAFLLLTLWALSRLGRASNRHRLMLQWVLLSLVGALCGSYVLLRAVNVHLDFVPPETPARRSRTSPHPQGQGGHDLPHSFPAARHLNWRRCHD